MKLLFDENLSRKLVPMIEDIFPGSRHLSSEGLLQEADNKIWEYAKAKGFSIVTADADFHQMATSLGPPPKVVWRRGCDYPTAAAERLIRSQAIRVAEFMANADQGVLILTPPWAE